MSVNIRIDMLEHLIEWGTNWNLKYSDDEMMQLDLLDIDALLNFFIRCNSH